MSKILTIQGLTELRREFRESGDKLFLGKYSNEDFDTSKLQILDAPDYPKVSAYTIEKFYEIFEADTKNEFELAKILHEGLPLSRVQASNNLFWVYLNLTHFFRYIKKKWVRLKEDEEELVETDIEKFFLSLEPSQNSLIKSPIAGLWWAIEITKDDSLQDPYHYSRIFLSSRNLRDKTIGPYQFIGDKKILFAVLDFFDKNRDGEFEGKRIGSEAIAQQLSKTLNQFGGLTLLSFLSQKELEKHLENLKDLIFTRARKVQIGKVTSKERLKKKNEKEETNSHYFVLDVTTKKYQVLEKASSDWDYCVGFNINSKNQYFIHIYKEGKIKQSTLDKLKEFHNRNSLVRDYHLMNGANKKLTLVDFFLVSTPVLICLVYKIKDAKLVKLIDQDSEILRTDNSDFSQEGKKVLYEGNINSLKSYILPTSLKGELKTLIRSPQANGINVTDPRYRKEIAILNSYINV
jgi:hypothetical protein